MKILYDNQIFSLQIFGGASKYYYELLRRIPASDWKTTTIISNNIYIRNQKLFNYCDFMPNHYFKGKASLMDFLNRPNTLYKLKYADYDIFHQTYYESYYFPVIKGKKMVTTFHDMNFSKYKEMFANTITNDINSRTILQKKSVERADKIIAVSHNTKTDLVELWGVNPEKIVVVHHGVDKNKLDNLDSKKITENPYILFVGERHAFKNFTRFIKAFSILSEKYPDIKLICTGRAFSNQEINEMTELKVSNKSIQISADEYTMAKLYRDAEMFVYPSYSEGFGMPILEAMVYNCPVAVSNASCLPEVAGNAGVYFDPYQIDDIVEKMESLLISSDLRKEKIALGVKQLEKFSWEKSAQEHIEVYRSLM